MALPKEPRQKMINLMYLVLTALLALNVSVEILNAFKTVNRSLEATNKVVFASTATYMQSLSDKLKNAETKEKAQVWYPKAQQVQNLANTAYNDVQKLKDSILRATGFDPVKNKDSSFKDDNIDAAQRIIVEGGEGRKLLQSLVQFKTGVLAIDPEITKEIAANFPLNLDTPKTEGKDKSWAAAYFHMTPTVAALTILSKFQNDIRTAENRAVEFCHNRVGHVELVYDQYQPLIGQNSSYLMPGQEIIITAGIGSFNNAARPQITIDGSPAQLTSDGSYQYKSTAGGPGSYSKKVRITYFNQAKNANETKEADVKYSVGSPTGITITPDAIKILYIGVDNPISITGGEKGAESITPSISQGSISKSDNNGHFSARVSSPGTATITVRTTDGKTATTDFKVRNIPPPTPKVGGSANAGGGRMSVNEFQSQLGVRADMGEFIFDKVKYDVSAFRLIGTGNGFTAAGPQIAENTGARFGADAQRVIGMCKAGSYIIIEDIKVTGPDGTKTLSNTLAFTLF